MTYDGIFFCFQGPGKRRHRSTNENAPNGRNSSYTTKNDQRRGISAFVTVCVRIYSVSRRLTDSFPKPNPIGNQRGRIRITEVFQEAL